MNEIQQCEEDKWSTLAIFVILMVAIGAAAQSVVQIGTGSIRDISPFLSG
jgi:hypothetical protein